jgi:hypothetical protein
VHVDDARYGDGQVTDADGRFHMEGLAAGAHRIFLPESEGAIGMVPPVDVDLAPGEVRDVTIDARACGTCRMDLTILIGGAPAVDAQVTLVRADDRELARLGTTDPRGHLMASVPIAKDVGIRLYDADGLVWGAHGAQRFDLELDAKMVETIRFETGRLVLVIPANVTMPVKWDARLQLTAPGANAAAQDRWVGRSEGDMRNPRVTVTDGGHRLTFDSVLAGEWQLELDVCDAADPKERVTTGPHSWRERRKTMYDAKSVVKVVSGQTATVELH